MKKKRKYKRINFAIVLGKMKPERFYSIEWVKNACESKGIKISERHLYRIVNHLIQNKNFDIEYRGVEYCKKPVLFISKPKQIKPN